MMYRFRRNDSGGRRIPGRPREIDFLGEIRTYERRGGRNTGDGQILRCALIGVNSLLFEDRLNRNLNRPFAR
jgi:hypothetical protein